MCRHYVAYYRVSTAKQGKSGLGLEAQEASALAFITGKGSDAKLLAAFTEVESGKKADRPELTKAMEHARLTGCEFRRNPAGDSDLKPATVPI